MSILVSGSLAYDFIMNFPDSFKNHIMPENMHILNVCFMVDELRRSWGGTGGNITYTMNLLGGEPVIVSAAGKNGDEYVRYFKEHNIKTDYIYIDPNQLSASAFITTDADNNQITAFHNGPLGLASNISLRDIKEKFSVAIIAPTQKEVMIKHLKECQELGVEAVFAPGQQITAFDGLELKRMIDQAHFVIGNDYEIKLMQERTGWSGEEILKNTKVLITTMGEKGSIISTSDGEVIEVGVCPPESFDDPTGAGDSYIAGFFTAYQQGLDLKTCGQVGSVAASYAIETLGTQEHDFTREEFCARYEKAYGTKLVLN
jgi:adenosine kinase